MERKNISVSKIEPNKFNPNVMSKETFENMKEGMKVTGPEHPLAVDPVIVSPKDVFYNDPKAESDVYVIVDGENRWRSAKELGWRSVPCEIRKVNEPTAKIICYRKNRERGSLDPLKEASLFKSELDNGLTQQNLAEKFNVSRTHVAHKISLIKLDEKVVNMFRDPEGSFKEIQTRDFEEQHERWEKLQEEPGYSYMSEPEPPTEEDFVPRGTLTPSHIEALATMPKEEQVEIAGAVLVRGLTVRETESRVKRRKEEMAREKRFKEALKVAKRRKCPVCGGDPKGFAFNDETKFKCGGGPNNRWCGNSWDYMKTRQEAEKEQAKHKSKEHEELTERLKKARENPSFIRMKETPPELHKKVKQWVLAKVLQLTEIEKVTINGKRGGTEIELDYQPPNAPYRRLDLRVKVGKKNFGFNVEPKEYKKFDANSRVDLLWGVEPTEENRQALRKFFEETVKTDKDPEGATRND